MNGKKLTEWLKNWKRNLLEVFVVAGILASACTTFVGAFQMVNRSILVAALFTMFFQGGMYVIGHYASPGEHERRGRRTISLCLTWMTLAFFSIWASSLGMFAIQQESLRSDLARTNIFKQWTDAAKGIADFKTRSLAEITQAKQADSLDINVERGRIRAARAEHRAYASETLPRLNSDLAALQSAESRVRQLRFLSITAPENSDDARRTLDEAFSAAGECYAAIPERLRTRIAQPRPIEQPEMSQNIQKAFVEGLKSRSIPVVLVLVFSVMLDLLPPLVLFATAPRKTFDVQIIGFRRWIRDLKIAKDTPLSEDIEIVQIKIQDLPQLNAHIAVPSSRGGPIVDIDRDFARLTAEVCEEKGREMLLESVRTPSGKALEDGLPLLKQLAGGRELVVSYVPGADVSSGQVS